MNKIPVVAVVGATASGKTSLAVQIAQHYSGEVVSADSMQIYKGMCIATAKPTEAEMLGVPHHMLDFLPVNQKYSVARYTAEASAVIADIRSRGRLPVVCGGTGLYINSLLENIVFEDEPDNSEVRSLLRARRQSEGIEVLYNELRAIDPETADALHINNEGRILRALEVYMLTGETASVRRRRSLMCETPYETVYIGIDYFDREKLYGRINKRVDIMLQNGLIDEAKAYYNLPDVCTASQAIGYKELAPYFSGEITLDRAVQNLKQATRRYAKRQLTWFRKNEKINWIYPDLLNTDESLFGEAVKITDNSKIF